MNIPSKPRRFLVLALSLVCFAASTNVAHAVNLFWTGDESIDWFTPMNWSAGEFGFGPPGDGDTATINNGDRVIVTHQFGSADEIDALTMSGGSILENRNFFGYEIVVHDSGSALTQLSGANTELRIWENILGSSADGFDTDLMTINSGALVSLGNGRLEVDSGLLDINAGATLRGYGWVDLEATGASSFKVLENDGLIHVYGYGLSGTPQVTLAVTATDTDGRIDLDGTSGNGEVQIDNGGRLLLNVPLNDAFDGVITMGANSVFQMATEWVNNTGGVINIDAANGTATIRGTTLNTLINNGVINVDSGTLVLSSNYQDDGAAINAVGTGIRTEAGAIFNSPNFNGAYQLTIKNGSNTTINTAAFNWDGNGNAVTTIEQGGTLNINATSIETFDGELLIAGDLYVRLPNASDTWTLANSDDTIMSSPNASIDGLSTLVNAANHTIRGTGIISLDLVNLGHLIAENGQLRLQTNIVSNSGTVTIAANGTLFMDANSLMIGGTLHGIAGSKINGFANGTLKDVVITGEIRQSTGVTSLDGTITNNGVITYENSPVALAEQLRVTGTAVLTGSGELVMNSADTYLSGGGALTNASGHTIRGVGNIQLKLTNSGVLRPEGLVTLTGDYLQTATGVLEIPVRGLTPGTGHGQLSVTGTATLGGTLRVLFENGFVPQLGNDVHFLTAAGIVGDFSIRSFPELAAVAPGLAVEMLTDDGGELTGQLRFVNPSINRLEATVPLPNPNFMNLENYAKGAPLSYHNVLLENVSSSARTIIAVADPEYAYSANPFVHTLTVGGPASSERLTLRHEASSTISATAGVIVDFDGVYEFCGGSIYAPQFTVLRGGTLTGTGTIAADVTVGASGASNLQALFSPGLDSTGLKIGSIAIDGAYHQGPNAVFAIDIMGDNNSTDGYDSITATGGVTLDGRIRIDVSNLSDADFTPGDAYDIILAGESVSGEFDRVDVIGRDDIYFSIDYGNAPAVGAGEPTLGDYRVRALVYQRGDGNQDGVIDEIDAMVLAAVLVNGNPLLVPYGDDGVAAPPNFLDPYDFVDTTADDTRVVDFYDVPYFARALAAARGGSLTEANAIIQAAVMAAYSWGSVPEPASCPILLVAMLAWQTTRQRIRQAC